MHSAARRCWRHGSFGDAAARRAACRRRRRANTASAGGRCRARRTRPRQLPITLAARQRLVPRRAARAPSRRRRRRAAHEGQIPSWPTLYRRLADVCVRRHDCGPQRSVTRACYKPRAHADPARTDLPIRSGALSPEGAAGPQVRAHARPQLPGRDRRSKARSIPSAAGSWTSPRSTSTRCRWCASSIIRCSTRSTASRTRRASCSRCGGGSGSRRRCPGWSRSWCPRRRRRAACTVAQLDPARRHAQLLGHRAAARAPARARGPPAPRARARRRLHAGGAAARRQARAHDRAT